MTDDSISVMQGTLDMFVLKALEDGDKHGYGVMAWIRDRSDEAFRIEEGACYPALHRLEEKGYVAAEWGLSENRRQAKFYTLTPKGRAQLTAEARDWSRYVSAVAKILGAG